MMPTQLTHIGADQPSMIIGQLNTMRRKCASATHPMMVPLTRNNVLLEACGSKTFGFHA